MGTRSRFREFLRERAYGSVHIRLIFFLFVAVWVVLEAFVLSGFQGVGRVGEGVVCVFFVEG